MTSRAPDVTPWGQYTRARATGPVITLHSRSSRIITLVEEMASPLRVVVDGRKPPLKVDLVVTAGKLGKTVELYACRLCALVVVLPEAADWTSERLIPRDWTTLVGADMQRIR